MEQWWHQQRGVSWRKRYVAYLGVLVSTGYVLSSAIRIDRMSPTITKTHFDNLIKYPFLQTLIMFLGEMMCLIPYQYGHWRIRREGREPREGIDKGMAPRWKFLPLALFDCTQTICLYYGLSNTSASAYQVLRGSSLFFTILFSSIILQDRHRKVLPYQWVGIAINVMGLGIVGLSMQLSGSPTQTQGPHPFIGCTLVVVAMVFQSLHYVSQDRLLGMAHNETGTHKTNDVPPLQCTGWEGVWGSLTVFCLLMIFLIFPSPPESLIEATSSWKHHPEYMVSNASLLFVIAFYNWCGNYIVKNYGALHRAVLGESVGQFGVWFVSVVFLDYDYNPYQLNGFMLNLLGTSIFYGYMRPKGLSFPDDAEAVQRNVSALLNDANDGEAREVDGFIISPT